jgi:tripartite-type tricarboxylate transporter receptor subunit TctC
MDLLRRSLLKSAAALPALAWPIAPAAAETAAEYPSRWISSIAAFPPGSGADVIIRFYSAKLQAVCGKPVIVENKSGSNGIIGTEYVAHAKPDGYTILIAPSSSVLSGTHSLFKKVQFDPFKDFAHVTAIMRTGFVMVVPANAPYKTIAELTDHLRKKGDKSTYASTTNVGRITAELYLSQFNLQAVEVSYRAAAAAINEMLSGQLDFFCVDPGTVKEQIEPGGTLRALVTSTADGIEALPLVPSAKAAGINMDVAGYWGVHVPATTPQPIIDKLAAWLAPIAASEDARQFLNRFGYDPWTGNAQKISDMLVREARNWEAWVKLARIEPQ